MNSNRNQKINQVSEKTLVIGIDIAKRTHYACAVDERGRVLHKSFPFSQTREGFDAFYERLLALRATHEKSEILVGFEPTGHYWMNLAAYLQAHGIPFIMVNPHHVNRSKELDDNLQTKNDQKDALVIARLMRDGRFSYPRILEGVEAELRNGTTLRAKIQEDVNALQNRMIRWLDRFFPEFTQVFKNFGKMAYAALEKTPLPMDIQGKTPEELLFLYRQVDGMKSPQLPKAKQLVEVAQSSIGLTEGLVMARIEIATLLSQYQLMQAQLDELTVQLIELAKQMTDYAYLASVPGIGDVTIVELLSEVGSLTQYEHPRQLIKLAGLTLRENSSGQHKGQKRISKRGRRKLRALLFRVMIPLIRHNEAFKQLHDYYTTRTINPLRKKQSIVVLCGKLLKILHTLCKKKVHFDVSQMMKDLYCLGPISTYSIDESWIVTDGLERLYGDIRSIAEHIQKKIMDLHGLPSAIGIGPNKLIAKLVLDNYAKKSGIAACSYQDVQKMFWPLPVENIWGIGERMKRNLNRMGIYLLGDLARTPLERMRKKFGVMGEQLFYHSWGVDLSPVFVDPREEMRKGFSSGITLMRDYSLQDVPVVIYELTDTLARKLRKIQAAAFTVSLSIGYSKHANTKGFSRSKTMHQASHTSKHLYETCLHLLKQHASPTPVRFIHVGVSNIIDAGTLQVDLFTAKQDEQLMKLGTVMDDIQKRFGPTALVRANALTEASTVINHSTKIGGHTG